jgi:opacity protein-like surface antigen
MKLKALVAGIAGSFAISTAAMAADPIFIPPPAPPPPMVVAPTGFDWNRFYVGVQAGAWLELGPIAFYSLRAALVAGRNVQVGERLVLGGEIVLGAYDFTPPPVFFEVYGLGRAGFLVTDRALLYAAAGAGYDFGGAGAWAMLLGGGAEFALNDRMTLRTEALAYRLFGDPFTFLSVTGGVSFYLGR